MTKKPKGLESGKAPEKSDTELDAMKQVVMLKQENDQLRRTVQALEVTVRVLKELR